MSEATPGRLTGRVAIVPRVGHKGQVGFALVQAFAREGASVVVSSRSSEEKQHNDRNH